MIFIINQLLISADFCAIKERIYAEKFNNSYR